MTYTLQQLYEDVMARLGENSRSQPSPENPDILTPEEAIRAMTSALLPGVGASLIREASAWQLGGGVEQKPVAVMRKMPCGLYAADIAHPDSFLRLVSVKMSGWRRCVSRVVMPEDPGWSRQWSEESGIAGNPDNPMVYLTSGGDGSVIRLMSSRAADDAVEWLRGWSIPSVETDGTFDFPERLYSELTKNIASNL